MVVSINRYLTDSTERSRSLDASTAFVYPLGGFFHKGEGDPMTAEDVKRKLRAILSADVQA